MKTKKLLTTLVLALGLIVWSAKVSEAAPMGTAFTYQGRLIDANNAADGLYDFQFKLYDANVAGTQKGSTIDVNELDIIDGYFTAALDFGSGVFDGNERWLEIGVRPGEQNDPNKYTVLSPRQKVTPTPYAIYAKTAGSVEGGIDWSEISDRPSGLDDGDQVGITSETDPTVPASIKDGISWSEVSNRPTGLDDGDDIGITIETDPQVGSNITNYISKWNGSELVSGTIYDNGNVGIGTTSPGATLDVQNEVYIQPEVPLSINAFGWIRTKRISDTAVLLDSSDYTGGTVWAVEQVVSSGSTGRFSIFEDKLGGNSERFTILKGGKVGIGTSNPEYKLDVQGIVQAYGYLTGDIIFQKDGRKLWRMFEDENGVYLENLKTGKVYSFVLEEAKSNDNVNLAQTMRDLQSENKSLKERIWALEKTMQQLAGTKEVR